MAKQIIDETEVIRSINILKPGNELFECRIVFDNKATYSGYFTSANSLIKAFDRDIRDFKGCNVYYTLNIPDNACYSRTQKDRFERNKTTTSDNDIVGYTWMLIDLDPVRPTGTSSTDEQLAKAKEKANEVYEFLNNLGFSKPVTALSGNGYHLLYRIQLLNNSESKELVKNCLETLDMFFSDDETKIDVVNFNPARISKLPGTLAQKGADTDDRPHRMSRIINAPENIEYTKKAYLQKLVGMMPQKQEPEKYNKFHPDEFDVESWMTKHGIQYKVSTYGGGVKYILDHCPFNSSHTKKDACVFKSNNGAIGFKCLHNSCSDKTWKDMRIMFEPDAYEKRNAYQEKQMYQRFNRDAKPVQTRQIVEKDGNPVFLTMEDIFNQPKVEETYIKSGITMLDRALRGFKKGCVSLITGLSGSGKSTILSQFAIEGVDSGNNVALYSGELTAKNVSRWIYQQAAGKSYVEPSQYEGYYNVPRDIQKAIVAWCGDRLWVYNNDYGNDFVQIINEFEKVIDEKKLDFLILDNLMAFDITGLSQEKNTAQTLFMQRLSNLAKEKNVHIMVVCHPRKSMGLLRREDISGTGDLLNLVDYMFIVHRRNKDFVKRAKETLGLHDDDPIIADETITNLLEISKDRDGGNQDDRWIPLYYEKESKRLRNDLYESKLYGWLDNMNFTSQYEDSPFDVEE